MKAVLISIQPKWCEKIANGEKTIEVRKTHPKLETPFKVYIYCTNDRKVFFDSDCNNKFWTEKNYGGKHYYNGKVIGEFVCDRIDSYVGRDDNKDYWDLSVEEWEELKKKSCLTIPQILEYTGDCCRCYGWRITDLKIYDKPKELSEFKKQNVCYKSGDWETLGCWEGGCVQQELGECDGRCSVLERPPQSWCYVEV